METYNNNFLSQERKTLEDTLLQVAIKIRDRIKESGHSFLLTQKRDDKQLVDSLYGYIYLGEDVDVYEREVKGFKISSSGELWICMDLSNIKYDEFALTETWEDINDDVWYLLLYKNSTLVNTDSFNVYLTLLSLSECVYQYFG